MAEPIIIKRVKSRKLFSEELLEDCYFFPTFPVEEGKYAFYSAFNVRLAKDIKSGDDFSFTLGPFAWVVSKFSIDTQGAHGDWVSDLAGELIPIGRPGTDDAEDEGSFQAMAGGHLPETAASASAY